MNNVVVVIEALCYKLQLFGVPIDVSTNIFCYDGVVYVNTTWPESTLSKKHHGITYHFSGQAVAEGTVIVSKDHTLTNLAGLFTKTMESQKREVLMEKLTY